MSVCEPIYLSLFENPGLGSLAAGAPACGACEDQTCLYKHRWSVANTCLWQ